MVTEERVITTETPRAIALDPPAAAPAQVVVRQPAVVRVWSWVDRLEQIVNFALGVVACLIMARVLLLAMVANPAAGFYQFMMNLTDPLVVPFTGLFGPDPMVNGVPIHVPGLVAIFVYAVATAFLMRAIRLLLPTPSVDYPATAV